ncbi:MAG: PQQ-dependent sugar dehydrogenase [Chloroflexota bacterium]
MFPVVLLFTYLTAFAQINLPYDPVRSNFELHIEPFVTLSSSTGTRINKLAHAGDGSGRKFINVQEGRIVIVDQNDNLLSTPFLDLNTALSQFTVGVGPFRGLTYFAFHPDFARSDRPGYRKLYTAHQETPNGTPDYDIEDVSGHYGGAVATHRVIAEWEVDPNNPNQVLTSSYREVLRLRFDDPIGNPHAIGEIAFNPFATAGDGDYGLLYVAVGDGGDGNAVPDASWAQDISNPFGKILRINPLQDGSNSYVVPSSNPFTSTVGAAAEIYAFGFRDPQNFSWGEGADGRVWMINSDIGQKDLEELNIVVAGGNYGWDAWEGTLKQHDTPVNTAGPLIPPVAQYDRSMPSNQINAPDPSYDKFAIVGGFVHTGVGNWQLDGQFIFTDLAQGRFFHVPLDGLVSAFENGNQATIQELLVFSGGNEILFSHLVDDVKLRGDVRFGIDESGEIYISSKQNRTVYRIILPPGLPQLLGDVTCDSQVNTADAMAILQFAAGSRSGESSCPATASGMIDAACDLSMDSSCDLSDALLILQCNVALSNGACPGAP